MPDGFRAGDAFKLYRWQWRWFLNYYLVRGDAEWTPASPLLAPAFVYRYGLLVGPQGIGKNPTVAAHVCLEAVGPSLFAGWAEAGDGYACADWGCGCGWEYPYDPGEPRGMLRPTPLIQITAFSEDSTGNTYDALRPMISQGRLAHVLPKAGEEFIRLPGGGTIDTVTSSNQSRLGQRVTFAPQDELGLWHALNKMTKLFDTQLRNVSKMGGRGAGTTNAWDPSEHSVAQREFTSASTDVHRQMVQPPPQLSYGNRAERHRIHQVVYEPETLREHGGHIDLDAIEAQAADLIGKGELAQAARFYGNVLMPGAGVAVEPEQWGRLARPGEVAAGTYIALGFDGSLSEDSTALRACTADGLGFSLEGWAWVRPVGDAMAAWQIEHPGQEWRVPRQAVEDAVALAFSRFTVGRMVCDQAYWRDEITRWQGLYGLDSEKHSIVLPYDTNSSRQIVPVFDRWKTAIREGSHTHDGDPVVTAHVEALHQRKARDLAPDDDGRTAYVPVKGEDGRKIDAALADMLAYFAAMTMAEPPQRKGGWAFLG